jgi:hypothetical protein
MSPELDPLGTPCRRIKWVGKILCFVDYLAVLEFHNADRVAGPSQVHNRIFSDPQVAGRDIDMSPSFPSHSPRLAPARKF